MLNIARDFWTGANQAHLALEDVPEFWQLVKLRAAKKSADGGDAGIVPCANMGTMEVSAEMHRAKFDQGEGATCTSDPALTIKGRPG